MLCLGKCIGKLSEEYGSQECLNIQDYVGIDGVFKCCGLILELMEVQIVEQCIYELYEWFRKYELNECIQCVEEYYGDCECYFCFD